MELGRKPLGPLVPRLGQKGMRCFPRLAGMFMDLNVDMAVMLVAAAMVRCIYAELFGRQ